MMNDLMELFDRLQQRLTEKQTSLDRQCTGINQSINQKFNDILEQLIELKRFCRNDIEQQTLNAQIEVQQMLDAVHYMRTKSALHHRNPAEIVRSFSADLHRCNDRLSKLALSPARDLDNLSSYLTASFSSSASQVPLETSPPPPPIDTHSCSPSPTIAIDAEETAVITSSPMDPDAAPTNELSHFKFGTSIALAYPCDMIASNGRSILAYAIEKNFLNYSTIVGVNLFSQKVYRLLAPIAANNARIWDIIWCPWSEFYIIAGPTGLYSLTYPYDKDPNSVDQAPHVNKLVSFRGLSLQHVRLSSHSMGWYIYMIEHQSASIDLYDRRSGRVLGHFDNQSQHDAIPLGFHGFCLNESLFAIVKKTEVLSTINNPHQTKNEQNIQVYFFDLRTMLCIQQMSLCHCSHVYDIKCCYEKNIFMILAEPMQLILVDLDTNALIRKKLLDDGIHLCVANNHELLILRSECSIQTLQYRCVK